MINFLSRFDEVNFLSRQVLTVHKSCVKILFRYLKNILISRLMDDFSDFSDFLFKYEHIVCNFEARDPEISNK